MNFFKTKTENLIKCIVRICFVKRYLFIIGTIGFNFVILTLKLIFFYEKLEERKPDPVATHSETRSDSAQFNVSCENPNQVRPMKFSDLLCLSFL